MDEIKYTAPVSGWYDIGNPRFLFHLADNVAITIVVVEGFPEPSEYLDRKEKYSVSEEGQVK